MKHTLETIAKLAGVSRGTVSRVVNQSPGVKPQVRQKVQRIIEETGYVPHPQARSLAGGTTGNIGVIAFSDNPDYLTHHIFYEVLQAIQADSASSNYDLLLFANRSSSDEQYWKRVVTRRKVDGLVIMGEHIQEEHLLFYRQQQIPFVLIGKRDFQLPIACVTSDYYNGAYLATKHLLASGKRNIVYIHGLTNMYHENARYMGYSEALAEAGIEVRPELVIIGNAKQKDAALQMNKLIEEGHIFDGIFAANDLMAFGAMEVLQQHDIQIPQQVAVVGFDDVQAAAYYSPTLTTVRQDKHKLGKEAMRMLLDMLKGDMAADKAETVMIECDLIIRETTTGQDRTTQPSFKDASR